MSKQIVVDSDAIFAIYNPNDPLNLRAIHTFEELIVQGFQLIYPTSVIFETISLFQRVLPTPKVTTTLINMLRSEQIAIYVIDQEILKKTAGLFNPKGSKKNTLVDCSIAVVARHINADAVFSYDSFYKKQGLKLAGELIESVNPNVSP